MSDNIKGIVTILGAASLDVFVHNGHLCIAQPLYGDAEEDFPIIEMRPDQLADLIPVLQRFLDRRDAWKDERDETRPKADLLTLVRKPKPPGDSN